MDGQARDELPVEVAPGWLPVEAHEGLGALAGFIDIVLTKAVAFEIVRRERPRAVEVLVPRDHGWSTSPARPGGDCAGAPAGGATRGSARGCPWHRDKPGVAARRCDVPGLHRRAC